MFPANATSFYTKKKASTSADFKVRLVLGANYANSKGWLYSATDWVRL